MLTFTMVNLVLAASVILFVYLMANKVINKVTAVQDLVQKSEDERKRIRRNGIFARLLRQLNKEIMGTNMRLIVMGYGYGELPMRKITLEDVVIDLPFDDLRDSSERGQICGIVKGCPTIESCADDLKYFVRTIINTVEREKTNREYLAARAIQNPADDPSVSLAEIGAPETSRG